ncbi:hypothetical protein SAY87_013933 [Trapa incisa]|uniref:CS domain-containing protein n=1 Tax=Trapa incisa TaxID=236973 RepID=A0AAN7QGP1_9MYRT|nr:hypothetical protein SAY87_013933 [Trapa incisa]
MHKASCRCRAKFQTASSSFPYSNGGEIGSGEAPRLRPRRSLFSLMCPMLQFSVAWFRFRVPEGFDAFSLCAIAGQKVFEWDQTLEEVNIYIELPPNVHPKQFYCKIQSKHVEVGIKGNPPYLNHDLSCPVKTDSSFWTLEDAIMHIFLQKRDIGQTWSSPIQGQGHLDPYTSDLEQKRLMLQRFQEENPGFDFSQAQFNGGCPDPRTFMGGIRSG